MLQNSKGNASAKPEAKVAMMANGVMATLHGSLTLNHVHGWIDRIGALGHVNWALVDMRGFRGADSGVWGTVEMALKKFVKKGVKRLVIVVESSEQLRVLQSAAKRAGVDDVVEYFDASARQYDSTRIVNYLREHSKA